MEGTADQPVQIDCDDLQFFADHMELFQKEGRVTARGNVVYISGGNRIYAERMVYYTKTRTGTFYVATRHRGAATSGAARASSAPRSPTRSSGVKSCRRSDPRSIASCGRIHDLRAADTALGPAVGLDHASPRRLRVLKNAIFRVKNVPLMYLPVFYYPIQEDNRATGFLIPIYSVTTSAGQSITNQFFWAINRSHDATFEHDWFSKTGQQIGGEYRYVLAPGSQGRTQLSFLNEHPTTTTNSRRLDR